MSREIAVEVEGATLERVSADVAVVPLFAGERPLRGAAGRVDWRLCGKLSALVAAGRLCGEPGEATLVATFGGLRVPLLVVLGAGESASFGVDGFETFAREGVARALGLGARSVALPFPDEQGESAPESRATALLCGAAAAAAAAASPLALSLSLIVGQDEVTRVAELLRRARPPQLPPSVSLRLQSRVRATASSSPPRGRQLVK